MPPELLDDQAEDQLEGGATPAEGADDLGASPSVDAGAPPAGSEQTAAEQQQTLRDILRAAGASDLAELESDDAAFNSLVAGYRERASALRQQQELQQLAQAGSYYLRHRDEFEDFRRQRSQPQQPQPAAEEKKSKWQAPDNASELRRWLIQDPKTGEVALKMGAPPDTVEKLEQWERHKEQITEQFASNPWQFIVDNFGDELREMIRNEQGAGFQQQTATQQVEGWMAANSEWIFERDPNGAFIPNPLGGGAKLTPQGQMLQAAYQEAQQLGIPNDLGRLQYAFKSVMAAEGQRLAQLQAKPTPEQVNASKKAAFTSGAQPNGHRPSRSGALNQTLAPPEEPQNLNRLLDHLAAQVKAENGFN